MRAWCLALALLAPAAAAQDQVAVTAYGEGRFAEAAEIASGIADADNSAFAARALLARAISTDEEPDPATVAEAWALAEKAVALEPGHVEGRLQLAIAMSLTARPMSVREALRSGYGEKARDLVREVIADDPGNAYAHSFLSVWNVEVLRRGGRLGATLMGASVKDGREHYEAAIAADPGEASLHWQWARVLTALNADKYRDEIDAALAAALSLPSETAIETIMQVRAKRIETAFATLSKEAVEGLAAKML